MLEGPYKAYLLIGGRYGAAFSTRCLLGNTGDKALSFSGFELQGLESSVLFCRLAFLGI